MGDFDSELNQTVWHELEPDEVLVKLTRAAEAKGTAVSGFLDTHQWVPFANQPNLSLSGGHSNAQYRRAAIGSDIPDALFWSVDQNTLPEHIHKPHQLRSWLYKNNAPDSSIGDIIFGRYLLVITEPDIELDEFGLKAEITKPTGGIPEVKVERLTSAANRADAIVSTLFNVSRNEAQTALKYGFVFQNFAPLAKRTQSFSPGDQVVYRTKGRVEISELKLNPKSKRTWVEFRRYPC